MPSKMSPANEVRFARSHSCRSSFGGFFFQPFLPSSSSYRALISASAALDSTRDGGATSDAGGTELELAPPPVLAAGVGAGAGAGCFGAAAAGDVTAEVLSFFAGGCSGCLLLSLCVRTRGQGRVGKGAWWERRGRVAAGRRAAAHHICGSARGSTPLAELPSDAAASTSGARFGGPMQVGSCGAQWHASAMQWRWMQLACCCALRASPPEPARGHHG